jgi:hypothetical protein
MKNIYKGKSWTSIKLTVGVKLVFWFFIAMRGLCRSWSVRLRWYLRRMGITIEYQYHSPSKR